MMSTGGGGGAQGHLLPAPPAPLHGSTGGDGNDRMVMMERLRGGWSGLREGLEALPYQVVGSSGHSADYRPENIMEDRPTEQASRWSSASNDQHQFIILKLDRPSLLLAITFGKFHKNHVCNLREFKVFVKACDNEHARWVQVLHSGLNNDTEAEIFPLSYPKWGNDDHTTAAGRLLCTMPVVLVKIVPMAAWGNNFNYSIWYVELRGISDPLMVAQVAQHYQARLQYESWRLCLGFLRDQPGMQDIYQTLQARTGMVLQEALLTRLHQLVIEQGALQEAQVVLTQAHRQDPSLFREYLEGHVPYEANWQKLERVRIDNNTSANPNTNNSDPQGETWPSVRGGHQMCWDPTTRRIYLLGGWNGMRDLGDFWQYDVQEARWECLSEETGREGGPGARSCHKMVLHAGLRTLYVLGRYVDCESRTSSPNLQSDFYQYDLERHQWTLISANVHLEGGPSLVYDHQMALDEERDLIYVFGGRTIPCAAVTSATTVTNSANPPTTTAGNSTPPEARYSGLYSYDIKMNRWTLLRPDASFVHGTPNIKARIGHSMVFNPLTRELCIHAGQRNKDYLSDFYIYDVDSDLVVEMVKETSKRGGPDAGFTQRATLDVQRQELFVFSGLTREKANAGNLGSTTTPTTSSTITLSSSSSSTTNHPSNFNPNNGNGYGVNHGQMHGHSHSHGHSRGHGNGNSNGNGNGSSQSTATIPPSSSSSSSSAMDEARNNFWLYEFHSSRWTRIRTRVAGREPCPRFAHQLVYDPESRIHYIFGGNPGESGHPQRRLNDFWQLKLERPLREEDILRRAIFLIRRQQFFEMCLSRRIAFSSPSSMGTGTRIATVPSTATTTTTTTTTANTTTASTNLEPVPVDASPTLVAAMHFLQRDLAEVVRHEDPLESQQFRQLSSWLLQPPSQLSDTLPLLLQPFPDPSSAEQMLSYEMRSSRLKLFNELIAFLPRAMRPPAASLADLVVLQ